ncbi:MAG TPA: HD domain-containing phosphohydrolase [Vicinamibacterales bacterium]|nr:HD domain-containing phosphohydrolase [Vicinamibacterales bacterium]
MTTTLDIRTRKPGGTILVVDDLETNLELLKRLLSAQGYEVLTARDGEEALSIVAEGPPDVVLTDIRMPRRDGFRLCRELKSDAATRLIPVVLMTGASEADDRIQAIEAGATDLLGKPIDVPELKARVRSLMQLKHFTDELDSAELVLKTLALMIEARDAYTQGHCERLARYATTLGEQLGLPQDDLIALTKGGYFHDIGKIAIPDAILLKPGPLTPEEFERMKEHPVIGERLCGDLRALHYVRPIVRHHHEHLDGSGYPDRLRADEVPLLAQIIGIVDVYDAITTDRPYRSARTPETAFAALRDEVRRGWRNRDLVETFIATRPELRPTV